MTPTAVDGPRVLIVEDDPNSRHYLELILKNSGCRTATAVNGREALEFLRSHERHADRVDLMLLDIVMPEMDGIELAELLHGEGQMPPTVVVTGTHHIQQKQRLRELGACVVEKPFTSEQLLDAVQRVLGKR
jgi:CheY-like chemotaxis protein